MASPRVLIFGGNGGIGRLMADSMLTKSWHVISFVRDPRQKTDVLQLGPKRGPKADVLVVDLARMKDEDDRSMSNGNAVDRDAAKKIIKAEVSSLEVTKFLMISFPASRRKKAPWWDNTDYQNFPDETRAYPEIAEAKLNADEYLVAMAKQRNDDSPFSFKQLVYDPAGLPTLLVVEFI
ncbi:hypothetical protein BOTCAL_0370g00120 [Botryotinia calthae]|uniref:NAD(P)-binding domain-containing protein n=1 Tax=Botryotinia calthae TaxID=38488 RepID=A0A4Y8CRT0_9HELO|nr:hypothetical protein BOTCAL_0370g00120 [Botryotinia calthae]